MWAIVVLAANRNQDAGRFSCFQDSDHLVGFGMPEVFLHKLVSTALVVIALGSIQNWSTPFFAAVLEPILELVGDFGQSPLGDSFPLPVRVEETQHPLRLLEGLDQSV